VGKGAERAVPTRAALSRAHASLCAPDDLLPVIPKA